jgi:hypothetical protein
MATTFADIVYQEDIYQIKTPAVVMIDKPWELLGEPEKEQLQKIADALSKRLNPKLKLDSFQVIHQPVFDLSTFKPHSERVIYFGQPVKGLNSYEVIEVNELCTVLSESLDELIKNEAARQKLWKALQQLFTDVK